MIYFSLPFTNYQMKKIKPVATVAAGFIAALFIAGNTYNTCIKAGIKVSREAYVISDGYPVFTSQRDYIKFVKSYPLNPGVKIRIHTIGAGESLWDICNRYSTDMDTIIAANPFMTDFSAKAGSQIAVPDMKGVLFAFDDWFDVGRVAKALDFRGEVLGDYKPKLLKLISPDDIRLVFFKDKRPVVLNPEIKKLYAYKRVFEQPVTGRYTSLFGVRIDPLVKLSDFHDGIDIQAPYGRPIYPARRGIVSFSGWRGGYGKTVVIMHDEGYISMYAHCADIEVRRGDIVDKNTVIGFVGSTGRSTGPHVHFSISHHGTVINPLVLIW